MFGLAAIPSVAMFIGLLFLPESPRWLIFHDQKGRALRVLKKIRSPEDVAGEFDAILEDFREYQYSKMGE